MGQISNLLSQILTSVIQYTMLALMGFLAVNSSICHYSCLFFSNGGKCRDSLPAAEMQIIYSFLHTRITIASQPFGYDQVYRLNGRQCVRKLKGVTLEMPICLQNDAYCWNEKICDKKFLLIFCIPLQHHSFIGFWFCKSNENEF